MSGGSEEQPHDPGQVRGFHYWRRPGRSAANSHRRGRLLAASAPRRLIALGVPAAPLVSGFFTEAGRVESGRRPRAADRPDGPDGRRRASPRGRRALVDPLLTGHVPDTCRDFRDRKLPLSEGAASRSSAQSVSRTSVFLRREGPSVGKIGEGAVGGHRTDGAHRRSVHAVEPTSSPGQPARRSERSRCAHDMIGPGP